MFMFNGCDTSDLTDEQRAELLSTLYPDIFAEIKGDDGDSAYQIAVDNGFTGTVEEWLQSLVGADGEDGEDSNCTICYLCDENITEELPIDPNDIRMTFELGEDVNATALKIIGYVDTNIFLSEDVNDTGVISRDIGIEFDGVNRVGLEFLKD